MTDTLTEETPRLLAWHGSAELKAETVARMRAHREADEFLKGDYLLPSATPNGWKGCFIGCLTAELLAAEQRVPILDVNLHRDGAWLSATQRLLGIPIRLGAVLESVFEASPDLDAAGRFAVEVVDAIPVGADLVDIAEQLLDKWPPYDAGRIVELLEAAPVPESAGAGS